MAKEKKLFIRQEKPVARDKWFTRELDGGISKAQWLGKPLAWPGSTLGNCVGGAWGAFAKREENPNCKVGFALGTTWPDDARDWVKNSKAQGYEIGMTPKLGAVACWDRKGALGHVANVEKVYDDNSWDSSESGYNTTPYWFNKHYNSKSYRNGYTFLGFIYPKYEFVEKLEPEVKLKVGDRVQIIGTGNSNTYGTGRTAYGIRYKRYILRIIKGTKYPYQVGVGSATTGFYKEEALKKL